MTLRKALVFGDDNRRREILPSETLEITGSVSTVVTVQNTQGSTISRLQAVYTKSDGSVGLARANASGTTEVLGLVRADTIEDDAEGFVQSNGIIEGETEDWDALTGQTGGLTPGSFYILSPDVAGSFSPRASTTITAGEFISVIGKAVTATSFKIEPLPAEGKS